MPRSHPEAAAAQRRIVYPIRGTDGRLIAQHVRIELPNGRKEMYWRRPGIDPRRGLDGLAPADLPLYGSERLARLPAGSEVVVVEGEKPADALLARGIEAVGTVTGTSSVPRDDVLAALLPLRVVLWPDHDRVGYGHMNGVAWALRDLGAPLPRGMVPMVELAGSTPLHFVLTKGFDAADARPGSDVRGLIDEARPWDLHREPERAQHRQVRPSYRDDGGRVEEARSHLADVVVERLGPPAAQKGRSLWWPCPFHGERTPSFKVDTSEPFFRCFGCGARGDVFTFLERIDGRSFKDALRALVPPTIRTVPVWSL